MKKNVFFATMMCLVMISCQPKNPVCVTGEHAGHDYVDLGLSVKWATVNIGAEYPEDCGLYFAWGEIKPKDIYSRDNYSLPTLGKDSILPMIYDAANSYWGGNWRIPQYDEIEELKTECDWTWTMRNGMRGFLITAQNGNSIFLPASGFRLNKDIAEVGNFGEYWASNIWRGKAPYHLFFGEGNTNFDYVTYQSYEGCSIRPVLK